jgi:asparagine synthase (glutamine-hydrolysing)
VPKFLHIQQFNRALDYPDLQPGLRQLGYTMLGNGQSFQQFGHKAKKIDEAKESWLLDIYPENAFKNFENLAELDAEFSGIYFHKMKYSVDLFRDIFGAKSLYYYFKNELLIVSNELRAILACLPEIPKTNDNKIAQYFNPAIDNDFINELTFFSNIKRVLPGQILHFRAGKIESNFYWQPKLKRNGNSAQLISAFGQRLKKSISTKTLKQSKVSANLGGGLDSSSICAFVSQDKAIDLQGIFFDTEGEASFEKKYAQEVASKGLFSLTEVAHDYSFYKPIRKITRLTCNPESMVIPSSIFIPIMQSAANYGAKVLLSGHGGDSTVGYGYEYIKELVNKFQFKKVKRALLNKWLLLEEDEAEPFEQYFIQQIIAHSGTSKLKLILFLVFNSSFSRNYLMLKFKDKTMPKEREIDIPPILKSKPTLQISKNNLRNWYKNFTTPHQFNYLKNSLLALSINSMETLDSMAREHKLVSSYPFFDKELLALASNVSSEYNFQNGYLYGTLRESMKGILQENVRLRTKKATFNYYGYQSFLKLDSECVEIFKEEHLLWTYVNKEAFDLHLSNIKSESNPLNKKEKAIWLCSRVYYLGIWLDEFYSS